ncbi:ABC transporter permease [Neobacillus sp. NPDC093127]|uniref:ABC transporter permease n=1 Tax=Neobacillus sp. NPDC093127 TaxID=3364296 RepID=UPI003811138E
MEIVTNKAVKERKVIRSHTTLRKMKKHWQFYILIIPPMLYIIIFKYLPLVGLQIAFRDFNVVGGIWGSEWVGLDHFIRFFDSPQFWSILGNTLKISVVTLIFTFPAPIILALLLNEVRAGMFKKISQTITFAPHFISVVVMAGMILLFLDPTVGILPKIFQLFGFDPVNYLASVTNFKFVYALSEVWQHTGYSSILYLAALAGVNPELYEAAKVDGASKLQKILHVDIPGILPAIVILLILAIGELTSVGFEKVLLLQNPVNLPGSEVIPTYVYQIGLINASYSYGTAIGIFNSAINFILLFVVNWIARKTSDNSLW